MNNRFSDFDLSSFSDPCIVCNSPIDPKKLYCSKKCRDEAAKTRKQVRKVFTRIATLGFSIEFVLGAQPYMRIPLYLQRFYPTGQNSFMLSHSSLIGRELTYTGEMWNNVKSYLGDHVYAFITHELQKESEDCYEFRKRLESYCDLGLIMHGPNFTCTTCGEKFLDSELTKTAYCESCNHCNPDKIPF